MSDREIVYEVSDHIATVTLDAPERLNAVSTAMLGELEDAARRAGEDERVRAVVLTGAGRAFSAGGNVKTMDQVAGEGLAERERGILEMQRAQLALRRLSKPLIAAVNGPAYGGGFDLACVADFRIAADSARFCEVYVRIGMAPGGGGAWLLPRIVGLTAALELILGGEPIDAAEALRIGLVSRVVPDVELLPVTRAFARRFTRAAPLGVQVSKRAVYRGLELSFDAALEAIRPHVAALRQTEDHLEGLRALADKREPRFQGR
jgi:2-(1,2-epoxy-1,2-dihydrophenyl)acetyl-CoA isomerase